MRRIIVALLSCAAAVAAFLSCEFDHGLGPSKTKITGKVFFFNTALRPDSLIDEVRVIAVSQLPPSGFGDIYFSNAVAFRADTAAFEILLPVGVYPAAGVLWKQHGKEWALNNLIGIYGFNPPNISLRSVEVTAAQPVVEVNLLALWDFANFDGTIKGKVRLNGNWPNDTQVILLAAFTDIPDLQNIANSLGALGGLPLPITSPAQERVYEISVRNGDYKFIGLFWKGKKSNDPKDIRCIGFYPNPGNPLRSGEFSVPKNGTVSEINFVADFSTLPEGVKLGGIID